MARGERNGYGDLPRISQSSLSSTPLCEPASHHDPIAQGKQEVRAVQLLTYLAMRAGLFYGDSEVRRGTGSLGYCLSALYPKIQSGVCLRS